jgi:hypothetical protein
VTVRAHDMYSGRVPWVEREEEQLLRRYQFKLK